MSLGPPRFILRHGDPALRDRGYDARWAELKTLCADLFDNFNASLDLQMSPGCVSVLL